MNKSELLFYLYFLLFGFAASELLFAEIQTIGQFRPLVGDTVAITTANQMVEQLRAELMTGPGGQKIPIHYVGVGTCRCRNKVFATMFALDPRTNKQTDDFLVKSQFSFKYKDSNASHTGLLIQSGTTVNGAPIHFVLDPLRGFIPVADWLGDRYERFYMRGLWNPQAKPSDIWGRVEFSTMEDFKDYTEGKFDKDYNPRNDPNLGFGRLVEDFRTDRGRLEFARSFLHMDKFQNKLHELLGTMPKVTENDRNAIRNALSDYNQNELRHDYAVDSPRLQERISDGFRDIITNGNHNRRRFLIQLGACI